ncbi:two-component sensor histidine kinase [Aureimonas endophytica]|uniref:histidine kinase n=1 Tax=Aureimonas endophytica TaxID=2027858 RepID=A0A916ZFS4_9HYPH|nr:ATP-binding protein [Aureimonas endophytica]GGD94973.1 two-component sensor histidine kinase [Aureimonas endophytica]
MSQSPSTETGGARDRPPGGIEGVPLARALVVAVSGPALLAVAPASAHWLAPAAIAGLGVAACLLPRRGAKAARAAVASEAARETRFAAGTETVVDALPEPALVVDATLQLHHGNPAALRAFGTLIVGEAISLRFRAPEFLAALEEAIATEGGGKASLAENRASGLAWAVDVLPLAQAGGGAPSRFLLLFRDRTAERRIERMRTDFVANASHELRTPLSSLIGFIETLQGPARDDQAARERFLAIMREQAARMSRLIDDLLSLSQIEMKRPPAPGHTVDLVELLEDVRHLLEPVLEDSGVTAELEVEPGDYVVQGEHDELVQVFSNLIENACKYGASGERVLLSLAFEPGEPRTIRATVRDFGPGIAAEHVPRLTERFYRVNVESSRAKRGTGLGLSIVRNILLRHSARLVIWSEPGMGSAFSVLFPIRKK